MFFFAGNYINHSKSEIKQKIFLITSNLADLSESRRVTMVRMRRMTPSRSGSIIPCSGEHLDKVCTKSPATFSGPAQT